ncbi:unnamed protein product [Aphanomyces euteiches]|uniref:Uncharacterized protein n=2 Tax=Aphanomyces euteiches TaxID=100861 RepID=A0A6G0WZW8_9STRA|nr:hypothetical protein Ae201684_009965 [Aphanomyces euteiches]KAH9095922.1 hypothetical protein Ae201684P_010131 [Aphanomyces euteiches]KAH9139693.1 hypothetical protein AeRB84_016038 [Aphanomyces euteiches]
MSQPPRGSPPPRPAGSPPPRPAGAPPPRPAGSPPPRPAGAPPPRPAGAPPPRPAGPPPSRPDAGAASGGGLPPRPTGAPPPRPQGSPPPRPNAPPPKPSESPPVAAQAAPPKPVEAPPRPIASPPKPVEAPPKESPPKPSAPPPLGPNESPPKPVIRPPPGAPPPSNVVRAAGPIAPPPGMPPTTIAPPAGPPPPKAGSPIKPPSGAPPVKPPPGAPPIKPPPGAPPVTAAGGIPGPPSGPPPGPPGPPKGAPPSPPKGAPPPPPNEPSPIEQTALEDMAAAAPATRTLVKKGRLHFKLFEARGLCRPNVKKDDKKPFKADIYCKLKVGAKSKQSKEAKSKTWKKSGQDVGFQEETLWLNLDHPETMLAPDNDFYVTVELWDENMIADELLGSCDVSLLRFMDGKSHRETIPLTHLKTRLPAGQVDIEFTLDIATAGMLSIVVMEGRNLKNMELIGKQDPYCKFEHGGLSKRTKTIDKGGTNPYFGEEQLCFWITAESWVNDMVVHLFDQDVGSDDLIGDGSFSVLKPMQVGGQTDTIIPLVNGGKPAGQLVVKLQFYPAGHLTLQCIAGRKLRDVDTVGRQDPHVKFSLEGACIHTVMRTKVDNDGGKEPEWNETFEFDVVDQFSMEIQVWDHDSMGDDDLIGEMHLSLLPIFRYGFLDEWYPLQFKGKFGSMQKAGELHLELAFVGPDGIGFPQHQPGMDTFDHRERVTKATAHLGGAQNALQARKQSAIQPPTAIEIVQQAKTYVAADNKSEFSEDDILRAFKFIDLDKNAFIGAAEIRHILICMGELITDAEVDEMVRMVDRDGDGQVSFEEFRKMVVHPDPGSADFGKEEEERSVVEVNKHVDIVTDDDRKREMDIKMQKKALLDRFIGDNNINLDMLRRVFGRFKKSDKPGASFEDFVTLFEVEPTGEYRKLHALYAGDKLADMQELLLGMANLLEIDKTMKAQFCFEIFDDDHNGFITEDELVNILRATHMTTAANVQMKAQTVLKQADADGDHKINLEEFHVMAKKFPNLIFPHIVAAKE